MLVLSRQRDESIMIGDNIVLTIVDIRGDKVRLGIQAPCEIPVHRREVFDAIHRNDSAYDKFKGNLNSKNFETAFDIFYEHRGDFGTREEVDKMYYGLVNKIQ